VSDFDVTDNYELEWIDCVTAELVLRSGTQISVELGALPELRVASRFSVFTPEGELINDHLEIWDDDASARRRMDYYTRSVINAEEPLGFPINWSNRDLVNLLLAQDRIALCPECLGDETTNCPVCLGVSYVRFEEFISYFNDGEEANDVQQ